MMCIRLVTFSEILRRKHVSKYNIVYKRMRPISYQKCHPVDNNKKKNNTRTFTPRENCIFAAPSTRSKTIILTILYLLYTICTGRINISHYRNQNNSDMYATGSALYYTNQRDVILSRRDRKIAAMQRLNNDSPNNDLYYIIL